MRLLRPRSHSPPIRTRVMPSPPSIPQSCVRMCGAGSSGQEFSRAESLQTDLSLNCHTLADFRIEREEYLDRLLTHRCAALTHSVAVRLKRVAQDVILVRTSGGASFRRLPPQSRFQTRNPVRTLPVRHHPPHMDRRGRLQEREGFMAGILRAEIRWANFDPTIGIEDVARFSIPVSIHAPMGATRARAR
jgi:hypothetical protein